MRAASSTWRAFVVAAASLCLATAVTAQVSQTKETVPGGTAKVTTSQVHGELVAKGSNWLIAKDAHGNYKLYNVQRAGRPSSTAWRKGLAELQMGTMLTSTASTTETPLVNRTTTITQGKVFWPLPRASS